LAYDDGLTALDLNKVGRIVESHRDLSERAWRQHFA
jgi:hypothetical protein